MSEINLTKDLLRVTQQRLAYLGYYNLIVDGIEGPGMQNAIVDFKINNGFSNKPSIGPKTLTMLMALEAKKAPKVKAQKGKPAWIVEAERHIGLREIPGKRSNPEIMRWVEEIDLNGYNNDDIPWCGLFVAKCMSVGSPETPQNFNRLGARAWSAYGVKVDPSKCYGCIGVFWRGSRKGWKGHVAFIVGEYDDYYVILGGNQKNSVSLTKIPKYRLLTARAPEDYESIPMPRISLSGAMSRNEA